MEHELFKGANFFISHVKFAQSEHFDDKFEAKNGFVGGRLRKHIKHLFTLRSR